MGRLKESMKLESKLKNFKSYFLKFVHLYFVVSGHYVNHQMSAWSTGDVCKTTIFSLKIKEIGEW